MTAEAVAALTAGVNFATIITGIGVIGAAVAAVYVSVKGAKMLLGMIRS